MNVNVLTGYAATVRDGRAWRMPGSDAWTSCSDAEFAPVEVQQGPAEALYQRNLHGRQATVYLLPDGRIVAQ